METMNETQQLVNELGESARRSNFQSSRLISPEANLFKNVIYQAVLDAREGSPTERSQALAWLCAKGSQVSSFKWYCNQLDLQPDAVLNSIKVELNQLAVS
jgi:hypothetical protein